MRKQMDMRQPEIRKAESHCHIWAWNVNGTTQDHLQLEPWGGCLGGGCLEGAGLSRERLPELWQYGCFERPTGRKERGINTLPFPLQLPSNFLLILPI